MLPKKEIVLERFVQKIMDEKSGDTNTDTERIRILANEGGKKEKPRNSFESESFPPTAGSHRKRSAANGKNDDHSSSDRTFYSAGSFSLSPSDLENSWKQNKYANERVRHSEVFRSECKISVYRSPVDSSYINQNCGMLPPESTSQKARRYMRSKCSCSFSCLVGFFTSLFPVLSWLPKYKLEYFLPDVISGFTISVLHIPQGMAYGILASLRAENGLYVSFFPVLIYFLLGTSRHISIGTFAVLSIMLSGAVYSTDSVIIREVSNSTNQLVNGTASLWPPTHLEIATTIAMTVGFWQLFLGVFQLGSLTVVLSDQLISGFSTGAAIHVAVSQLKDLFGIHIGRYSGPFKLIYMMKDLVMDMGNINVATLIVSAVSIFVLVIFKEQIDARLKRKIAMPIPIPIDLILVVLATTASYFGYFHEKYKVAIMGEIPTGLPAPVIPRFDIMRMFLVDSFAIALVAFTISLSMAKLLSKKHKYPILPNQELFALGCANIFSSFFSCYPSCASLSRSIVQEKAGGKTQVAGLVSCGILLLVLLSLAPLFYNLPRCILACIILVALKGMFLQVKDLFNAWGISKLDALIWLITFLSTVILDVIYGLVVGVIFSVLTVIMRTVIPSKTFLGRVPDTDIYLDINRYSLAQEIKGIKIFHFESALYFINRELFKSFLNKNVPINRNPDFDEEKIDPSEEIHRIIIDCSTFTFVDTSGIETLLEIIKEYHEIGISVFLAGCSMTMQTVLGKARFEERVPQHPTVFPTIQDAVEYHFIPHSSVTSS